MIGGQHQVQTTLTKLAENDRPCRILTIRLDNNQVSRITFADASKDEEPHGYLVSDTTSGESWTFGPFGAGMGIRPSDIFIQGTASAVIYWNGLEA